MTSLLSKIKEDKSAVPDQLGLNFTHNDICPAKTEIESESLS